MAVLQLRKKGEKIGEENTKEYQGDIVSIDKLPEEFLRIEYPSEWKYLQKVRRYSVFL